MHLLLWDMTHLTAALGHDSFDKGTPRSSPRFSIVRALTAPRPALGATIPSQATPPPQAPLSCHDLLMTMRARALSVGPMLLLIDSLAYLFGCACAIKRALPCLHLCLAYTPLRHKSVARDTNDTFTILDLGISDGGQDGVELGEHLV